MLAALLAGPESVAQVALLGATASTCPRCCAPPRAVPTTRRHRRSAPHDDAQALAALGIDLDEVRRQVEDAFGPGALERTRAAAARRPPRASPRWDRSAKKVLELSLREALRLRHSFIGTEHVLLGLLHPGTGAGQEVLAGAGVRLESARTHVADLLGATGAAPADRRRALLAGGPLVLRSTPAGRRRRG